jgi:hypothetical protein
MHAQVATAPALELLKNVILQVLMYIQCMSGNTQAGRSTGHRSSRGFQVQSNLTLHTCLGQHMPHPTQHSFNTNMAQATCAMRT